MKVRFISALALSLALSQIAASAASAAEASTQLAHFRTAAPQTFSAGDLQRYGLGAQDAAKVASLQAQGYHVSVMSPEEARQYHAGDMSRTTWLLIGAAAIIVIVAVAAGNN
jgi:hypothetical protein